MSDRRPLGVTTVLRLVGLARFPDMEGLPPAKIQYFKDRGTYVHQSCDLIDAGTLDWAALSPVLRPYAEAYQQFLVDVKPKLLAGEEEILGKDGRYRGRLDRRYRIAGLGDILVDLKTSEAHPSTGPQLAAYEAALPDRHHRYALVLRKTGRYSLEEFKDPRDLAVWFAALEVAEWILAHNLMTNH